MHTKLDYDDIIYVNEEISKVEFINFIIGYMKYIEPIINELHFHQQDNIIQLIFTNKVGKVRKTIINRIRSLPPSRISPHNNFHFLECTYPFSSVPHLKSILRKPHCLSLAFRFHGTYLLQIIHRRSNSI